MSYCNESRVLCEENIFSLYLSPQNRIINKCPSLGVDTGNKRRSYLTYERDSFLIYQRSGVSRAKSAFLSTFNFPWCGGKRKFTENAEKLRILGHAR